MKGSESMPLTLTDPKNHTLLIKCVRKQAFSFKLLNTVVIGTAVQNEEKLAPMLVKLDSHTRLF